MIEGIYAEAFVGSVLSGDAALLAPDALNGTAVEKVHKNAIRQGAALPVVLYSVQPRPDVNSGNGVRLMTAFIVNARVVGEVVEGVLQHAARVRKAAHRLDDLLRFIRRQQVTFEDGTTLSFNVWRETELPQTESPGATAGTRYRYYGGLYLGESFA